MKTILIMKATIENGVLWIGSETYEEVLITDKWISDNAEGIKQLILNYAITGRRGTSIEFTSIVLKDKSIPPFGFKPVRKTPKNKAEILSLYYEWLRTPTNGDMPFDKLISECED